MLERKIFWMTSFICCFVIAGIFKLEIITNYYRLFNPDHVAYQTFKDISRSFNINEGISVTVQTADGDIFAADTLDLVDAISHWAEQLPYFVNVSALTRLALPPSKEDANADTLDTLSLYEQLEEQNFAPLAISEVKKQFEASTYYANFLLSTDLKTTAIFIEFDLPPDHPDWEKIRDQITEAVEEKVQQLKQAHPDHVFNAAGVLLYSKAFIDSMKKDALIMPILLFSFAFLILWAAFRSVKVVFITLILTNISMLMTLGLQGWFNLPVTQINMPACIIVMTLVLTSSIHIWSHATGPTKPSVMESWRVTRKPIFYTTVTTAIGFLSLTLCDSLPFRELGYSVALGIFGSFFVLFGLLPELSRLFALNQLAHTDKASKIAVALTQFSVTHSRTILLFGSIGALILISQIPQNELNDSLKEYFPEDMPIRTSVELMEKQMNGVDQFVFTFSAGEDEVITSPEFLNRIQLFQDWLEQQPEVSKVLSPTDFIKQLSIYSNQDYEHLSSEEIEELLDLYAFSDKGETLVQSYFNFEQGEVRQNLIVRYMSSQENIQFYERATAWLKGQLPSLEFRSTALSTLYAYLGKEIIANMIYGSILALVFVTLMISLMFRSFKLGLVSIFPNLLPPLILFGIWAMVHGEVNMGVATVFAISFGIIVDDTIHLLERLRSALEKMSFEQAVQQAFGQVGKAILTSSVMLSVGMLCLTVSDFTVASDMGLMIASITLIALVFDLVFLPALLVNIKKLAFISEKDMHPRNTIKNSA